MFNDDSRDSMATEENSRQSINTKYVTRPVENKSFSASTFLPSNFPTNDTYAPVYVMRKLV